MATQKKIDTVKELTDKFSRAKALFLADYRGLKHKQLEELRKLLKKTEGEFVVTKNRLLLKALGQKRSHLVKEQQGETFTGFLTGTTATLFSFADEVAPLKELLKFFKTAGVGKPKAGLLGATLLTESEVARLSTIPGRQQLLAQIVGQLNAPIQGLHYALSWNINRLVWGLQAVREKKTT
ncbi:50S ribosomal protein L10 [Candidatus Gottesmanbacteria bacterium]|nr:50S ribosomal protein L10 [Candidatus Gottesmanbacteria bacterium]